MRTRLALFATAALALTPAMAQAPANRLDPRDVQKSSQEHPQLVAEFGGAETGPRAAYVESVGRRVASYSGTANAGQLGR